MNLPLLAWLYIVIWALVLNACWLITLPQKFSALPWRAGLWFSCIALLLAVGAWLDTMTYLKPHSAYINWEFYATFIIISALISSPSFLYFRSQQ